MTSTVIKAAGPHRPADALPFRFDEMERHASGYLDTVRAAAAKIVAQAKQEADSIRKNAHRDGQQAAVEAARKLLEKDVARQLESLIPAVRAAIDNLAQARADCLRNWEQNIVHLAAAIAARVIRGELTRQPEIPARLVHEALELATGSPQLTVRLHPHDHAALASHVTAISAELNRQASTQIVADPAITPGGCRIDTQFGSIDQQIESQLARIEQELTH
jgi:flagellar assembly protein FliH